MPESFVGLSAFLKDLFSKSDECHAMEEWYCMVLDILAVHVANRASTNTIGSLTPEHFHVLRTEHKARRLDSGIAVAGAQSVADKRFRSTSRMAQAGNIEVQPQTARSVDESPNTLPIKFMVNP